MPFPKADHGQDRERVRERARESPGVHVHVHVTYFYPFMVPAEPTANPSKTPTTGRSPGAHRALFGLGRRQDAAPALADRPGQIRAPRGVNHGTASIFV